MVAVVVMMVSFCLSPDTAHPTTCKTMITPVYTVQRVLVYVYIYHVQNHDNPLACTPRAKTHQTQCFICACQMDPGI